MIEPVPGREKFGLISEMPLTDDHGGVSLWLQEVGNRLLIRIDPVVRARHEGPGHADSPCVTSGHQLGSGRRTLGRTIKTGHLHPLRRHPVEVWCAIQFGSETPDVPIAHIIDQDNDDIRLGGRFPLVSLQSAQKKAKEHSDQYDR